MTVSAANVIAVSDIKDVAWKLRSLNAPFYDGKNYIGILTSEQCADIVGDTAFISMHQYTEKGIDNLYNGEIGSIYGVRIIDAPQGPAVRGSNYGATASSIAYGAVIFGKGFYGAVGWGGSGMPQTYLTTGATKSDPLNQFAVYGWKANMAAKLLNPSCGAVLWTGSRDTTTADAESAGSGLRHEDPSSY